MKCSRVFATRFFLCVSLLCATLFLSAGTLFAKKEISPSFDENTIIPKPVSYRAGKGKFVFKSSTRLVALSPEAVPVAEVFSADFKKATGIALKTDAKGGSGSIRLEVF